MKETSKCKSGREESTWHVRETETISVICAIMKVGCVKLEAWAEATLLSVIGHSILLEVYWDIIDKDGSDSCEKNGTEYGHTVGREGPLRRLLLSKCSIMVT